MCVPDTHGGQKRVSVPLEPELQMVGNTTWVLGMEPGPLHGFHRGCSWCSSPVLVDHHPSPPTARIPSGMLMLCISCWFWLALLWKSHFSDFGNVELWSRISALSLFLASRHFHAHITSRFSFFSFATLTTLGKCSEIPFQMEANNYIAGGHFPPTQTICTKLLTAYVKSQLWSPLACWGHSGGVNGCWWSRG